MVQLYFFYIKSATHSNLIILVISKSLTYLKLQTWPLRKKPYSVFRISQKRVLGRLTQMQKPAYFTNNFRIKSRTKKKATVGKLFEKYLLNVLLPLSACGCAVTTKEDFSFSVTRTWSAHKWAKGATHNVILSSTTESWEKKEIVQGRERRDVRIRIIYMWITKPEELQWTESGTFLYLWVMYVFVMWMLQAVSSHIHNYHRSSCWVLEANRITLSHAALALSLPL